MCEDGELVERRGYYHYVEWKVEDFLPLSQKNNENLYSGSFFFSDIPWYLNICLEEKGWLGLYLFSEYECKVTVCFTLGLKAADDTLHKSRRTTYCFMSNATFKGWSDVVEIDELVREKSNLCPNGMITVYCEMRLKEECLADAESQTLLYNDTAILTQNLSDLYLKQQLCDVTINVGGREFQAHRSILAVRSTVFASMFEHDMKEKKSGVIEIEDCDPDAFHDFLLYLYTAKVDTISSKNAIALYCIADKYDLPQLTGWCEQYLLSNLSVELFCDVLVFAIKYNKSALIKAAEDFFEKYVEEILVTVKWQHFMKDHHIAANELFIKFAQAVCQRKCNCHYQLM